jgi:molybdopterin biosynthesis enzyme MoaB
MHNSLQLALRPAPQVMLCCVPSQQGHELLDEDGEAELAISCCRLHLVCYYQMAAKSPVLEGGFDDSVGDFARFGVVTVSDRASQGIYDDLSGPAILGFFQEAVKSRWPVGSCVTCVHDMPPHVQTSSLYLHEHTHCRWQAVYRVIPDERPLIEETLKDLVRVPHVQVNKGACWAQDSLAC